MSKVIENYVLGEVIGSGQYGKVYKARNMKDQSTVAVKVMKLERFKEIPKLQQFTSNQIQILSKIQNPHVVRFIQIIKTSNNVYLIYEFCSGGTLESLISKKKFLSEAKTLTVLQHILEAFRSLTKANILHRDLKPSNILLHDGYVKIADFGFCKSVGSQSQMTSTMVGSPIYMAPEVLKGMPYTTKADIWSLGVVLFECLFGFCPYEDKSIAKLIGLIDSSRGVAIPKHINQISQKTQQLLKGMLTIDVKKRVTWQELFNFDFSQVKQRQRNNSASVQKKMKEKEKEKENKENLISERVVTPNQNYSQLNSLIKERNKTVFLTNVLNSVIELNNDKSQTVCNLILRRISQLTESLLDEVNQLRVKNKSQFIRSQEFKVFSDIVKRQSQLFRDMASADGLSYSKSLVSYAQELRHQESSKSLLHANDILDCVLLQQLFENFVDKQMRFTQQRYFKQVKESTFKQLQSIVQCKLKYAKGKIDN